MCRLSIAVEVPLADGVRRNRQALRRLREDVFDGDHRLRTTEAAERGLRRLVRAADAAGRLDVRQVVRVVAVEERPPHDRLGEIEAEPAIGEERDAQRFDLPGRGKPRRVAHEIRMALARERHVELTRQPHAHWTARLHRPERGDGGPRVRLHLLAAERAAHAHAFHGHVFSRQPEHARDDFLRLRRMLRGRLRDDAARLVDPGDRRLRFQIEVLLAADRQLAVDAQRGCHTLERGRIAARKTEAVRQETPRVNRLLDRQDGRQRVVFHDDACGAALRRFQRLAEHPRHGLAVIHHLGGKQWLVMTRWTTIGLAWRIARAERRHDARLLERRRGIQARHARMRVRSRHRPRVQQVRKARDEIVRVHRAAGHVAARALVRKRLTGDRHGATPTRISPPGSSTPRGGTPSIRGDRSSA